MKHLKKFIFWIFSFFPHKQDPTLPVVVITPSKNSMALPDRADTKLVPIKDNAWNPFLKYPRNEPCFCNSGRKAKKCCLLGQPLAIEEEIALKAKPLVKFMRDERVK